MDAQALGDDRAGPCVASLLLCAEFSTFSYTGGSSFALEV